MGKHLGNIKNPEHILRQNRSLHMKSMPQVVILVIFEILKHFDGNMFLKIFLGEER